MPLFNKAFSANIIAFTSDRSVDFTLHEEQTAFNQNQREFLFSQLDLNLPEPVHVHQVHGDNIIIAEEFLHDGQASKEADGLITKVLDLPLAVRSADCLSVFLYDEKQKGIGLIHVGWKGSQKNIIRQTIELMKKQWQTDPKDIKVAFGPAIRSCCYEVGSEFQDYFPEDLITRDGRYYLDLPQMVHNQLLSCGAQPTNISDCGICTCCDSNYFSFRRENEHAGRMISLIMLKKENP